MSADNAVGILKTIHPEYNGKFEYRMSHIMAPDCLDNGNVLEFVAAFGEAEIFTDNQLAMDAAIALVKNLPICEYGIIEYNLEIVFPNMTKSAANGALRIPDFYLGTGKAVFLPDSMEKVYAILEDKNLFNVVDRFEAKDRLSGYLDILDETLRFLHLEKGELNPRTNDFNLCWVLYNQIENILGNNSIDRKKKK